MFNSQPKVSVEIPVYNSEIFLEACLESLLKQSFTDFEIIISDNASIDRTAEICQEFEQQDYRDYGDGGSRVASISARSRTRVLKRSMELIMGLWSVGRRPYSEADSGLADCQ